MGKDRVAEFYRVLLGRRRAHYITTMPGVVAFKVLVIDGGLVPA